MKTCVEIICFEVVVYTNNAAAKTHKRFLQVSFSLKSKKRKISCKKCFYKNGFEWHYVFFFVLKMVKNIYFDVSNYKCSDTILVLHCFIELHVRYAGTCLKFLTQIRVIKMKIWGDKNIYQMTYFVVMNCYVYVSTTS